MRARLRARSLLLSLIAALAGCATADRVGYTPINPTPRPFERREPAEVEIFASSPPTQAHVDVGILEVEGGAGEGGFATLNGNTEMLSTLRLAGALRGCDALYLAGPQPAVRTQRRTLTATCVVYREARRHAVAHAPAPLPSEGAVCGVHAEISQPPPAPRVDSSPAPAPMPLTVMSDHEYNRGCRAPLICGRAQRCVSPFQ